MKTRTGFVSNSSSSSFVLVTTVENHERALARLSEQDREYVKKYSFEQRELFGANVVWLSSWECEDSGDSVSIAEEILGSDGEDDVYDLAQNISGAMEEYIGILEENKSEVFYNYENH